MTTDLLPVTLDLCDDYLARLHATPQPTADYTFTNLWGWAEYYGLRLNFREHLCWISQTKPEARFWAPVGDWAAADWESQPEIQQGCTLHRVPNQLAELLVERLGADRVQVEPARDQWEYLYSREELATLPGNRFHKKKNLVNQYRKLYGMEYHELTHRQESGKLDDVLDLQQQWCLWRDCGSSPSLLAENEVIYRVVGNWGRLPGLIGGSLYVDGKMTAFTIGEGLGDSMMVLHFEKVKPEYKGVYQAINNAFAVNAPAQYSIFNREQDMGEEGLRQAKETYNPVAFLEKSTVCIAPRS